jgi:hypothetical protein
MDEDGYPDEEQLRDIQNWEVKSTEDLLALFMYARSLWWPDDHYFHIDNRTTKSTYNGGNRFTRAVVHTVGWSGNESIIDSMMNNCMVWSLCWSSSKRGGHYVFHIPVLAPQK